MPTKTLPEKDSEFAILCYDPTRPVTLTSGDHYLGLFDDLEHALHSVRAMIRYGRTITGHDNPSRPRTLTMVFETQMGTRLGATSLVFEEARQGMIEITQARFQRMQSRVNKARAESAIKNTNG